MPRQLDGAGLFNTSLLGTLPPFSVGSISNLRGTQFIRWDSALLRGLIMPSRNCRAGRHPTPYVSIEADGDFERVLGCPVNESKTTLIEAEHLLGLASQSLSAEAITQTKIELNFACLFP